MDNNNMYNNNQGAPNSYQPGVDYSQPYNPQGGQPGYNPLGSKYTNPNSGLEKPLSVGDWIITFLILMIPCLNLVMMFVWAFSSSENKTKSNFFKAYLILVGVITILYLIGFMLFGATIMSSMSQYGQYY